MKSKLISILLATCVLAIVGCQNNDNESTAVASDASNRAYIDGIVPHHEMALVMADEALEKAVHPSLKVMAAKMKADQSKEIAKFKEVRKNLLGSDVTPDPMPMEKMPAGEMFDKMFLHMMIDHHQGAIDQSILALDAGVVHPLDSLAKNAIEAQKMEQKMMQDSLKAWYNEEHNIGDGPHM